jgi:hypothetical protein
MSTATATPIGDVMNAMFGFWCTITGDRVKQWQAFQRKNINPEAFNPNEHWRVCPITQDARYEKSLSMYTDMEIRHCHPGTQQWNGRIDRYKRIPQTEIWERVE